MDDNGVQLLSSLLQTFAMITVAGISFLGVWLQTRANSKIKKQEDILTTVDSKIDAIQQKSMEDDRKIEKHINEIAMNVAKRYLVVEMTKIEEEHYIPTEEQKRVLYETKEEYNRAGGNSYVDAMFERLQSKGRL